MDPGRIEEAITKKTKAIIPVHFAGQSCDMDKILDIAKRYDLFVIEDCAHAHGSEWRGRKVGSLGDMGTFSFQSSKTMTSGEGGIITTNSKELAIKCFSLIWIGREIEKPWYEFYHLGWNFRLTEFQGAILRAQLSRLELQVEKRMENARYLTEKLSCIPGIKPMKWDSRATKHSFYLYMLRFDPGTWGISRRQFQEALAAEGVDVFGSYPAPIYQNDVFLNQDFYSRGCPVHCPHYNSPMDYSTFSEKCPVAERVCKEESIWLNHPMFLGSFSLMDAVAATVQKIWDNREELQS
jgi:dTDP-4-amino-4,6-dideoxygalactose transaminase